MARDIGGMSYGLALVSQGKHCATAHTSSAMACGCRNYHVLHDIRCVGVGWPVPACFIALCTLLLLPAGVDTFDLHGRGPIAP